MRRRNLELKAHDDDPSRTLAAALALPGVEDRGELHQVDTYFRVPRGRLKLREQAGAQAQLVQYERPDRDEARESVYRLTTVTDPGGLKDSLAAALGVRAVVDKRRRLLLWRDVRIHLDRVAGLGPTLELEHVEAPDGDRIAELTALLAPGEPIAGSYCDLLERPPEDLLAAARAVRDRAHAPYSRFRVGAALRDEHGRLHAGANVESAAYPQGLCAEAAALGALVAAGGTRVTEVAVADAVPCGGCRQKLAELGTADVPVYAAGRRHTLGELLPHAFALAPPDGQEQA